MNEINEEKITQDINNIRADIEKLINARDELNEQRDKYVIIYAMFMIILIMSTTFNSIIHILLLGAFFSMTKDIVGLIYSKMIQKKLNKDYTENEIRIIENILEEKAKVLTKKLDNNNF